MGAAVRGGSTAIVGTSSGLAPCERSRSDRIAACSLVRGTSTVQPNSARDSHQDSLLRAATAAPIDITTQVAFAMTGAASDSIRSRVEETVRWSVVVPSTVTDTGVSPARPCSTSAAATLPISFETAVTTRVPGAWASATQSTSEPPDPPGASRLPLSPPRPSDAPSGEAPSPAPRAGPPRPVPPRPEPPRPEPPRPEPPRPDRPRPPRRPAPKGVEPSPAAGVSVTGVTLGCTPLAEKTPSVLAKVTGRPVAIPE